MKKIVIPIIVVLAIAGGYLLIPKEKIEVVKTVNITTPVIEEKIIGETVVEPIVEVTVEPVIENTSVAPIEPIVVEPVKSIDEYIKLYFGEAKGVDTVEAWRMSLLVASVTQVVQDFPEKFTEENRKESFEFLVNHYNDPQYFGGAHYARVHLSWYQD